MYSSIDFSCVGSAASPNLAVPQVYLEPLDCSYDKLYWKDNDAAVLGGNRVCSIYHVPPGVYRQEYSFSSYRGR